MSASSVLSCPAPGDLVSTTTKSYKESVEQAMSQAASNSLWTILELDLRAARYIDSVGINLLILLIRRMKERGGTVRILIGNANLKRVLTFMRVDQHADIILS